MARKIDPSKMRSAIPVNYHEHGIMKEIRILADQAFSRAAGAPHLDNNHVRLLKDARENYPAWLDAISAAKKYIYFENYIIYEDEIGNKFADAFIKKAHEGVRVRLIYDWLGCFRKASKRFWTRLRENGVEVRCYNPPQLDSPFGWLSRDHRKTLIVDGKVAFVTGLCVGKLWTGIPEKNIKPWRDTGVEVHGIAVADIEQSFAQVWAMTGEPIPENELVNRNDIRPAGDMCVRVVAGIPAKAGMFRLDQLVAALARKRLWLTDAYFAGTALYMQSLIAVAKDGVDVRLLVPNATDLPILKPLSRIGYNSLLEAGARVFEWNGSMLHSKTAVADGRWARVGSTNLNIASWFGNCELDIVVENESFAREMEKMYLHDLTNSTEIILDERKRVRVSGKRQKKDRRAIGVKGSGGRAAAGVIRISNVVGSAFTGRRMLNSAEDRLMTGIGALLLIVSALIILFPRLLSYPVLVVFIWLGISLIYRGYKLFRKRKNK